jgi:uncharacterized membrane protein
MGMAARSSLIRGYFYHHARFYPAALLGVAVYFLTSHLVPPARIAAAGDAFFLAYLIASAVLIAHLDEKGLKKRAAVEDEGALIVLLITLAVIALCSVGIFTVLNQKQNPGTLAFVLSVASAPLAWFSLHTISAFHYANLHYLVGADGKTQALKFPGTGEPGSWDFLYFSFVVGMTAQVSDVQVLTTQMRRATLKHSIVSFFFNTVLIAMAVNAVVATAS